MEENLEMKIKKAHMDPELVKIQIEDFIIKEITESNLKGGIIGLSGGIDSTLVAYLAKGAFDRYNTNHDDKINLYGVILPAGELHDEDTKDAIEIAETLGIEYKVIDIEPVLDARKKVNPEIFEKEFHNGNAASRERMIQLYGEANENNCLVLGTGNKDEDHGIKYFTKYGDGGVDISPIGNLPKRLVRELASYIGVQDKIIKRESTARLWPGQTDKGELGYDYDPHVETIIDGFDQNYTREEIKQITGFAYEIIDDVKSRHDKNEHKMNMPPVAEIALEYR